MHFLPTRGVVQLDWEIMKTVASTSHVPCALRVTFLVLLYSIRAIQEREDENAVNGVQSLVTEKSGTTTTTRYAALHCVLLCVYLRRFFFLAYPTPPVLYATL